MRRTCVFDNAVTGLHEIRDPRSGELVGWNLVILDNEDNTAYELPLALGLAKEYGSRMVGIKGVSVANGADLTQEIRKTGGKR